MNERGLPSGSPPLTPNEKLSRVSSQPNTREQHTNIGLLEDTFHTQDPHLHYAPKLRPWHRRAQSPGLKWKKEYTPETARRGRVYMIDYIRQDHSKEGMRKVVAQEIDDIDSLRKIYTNPDRCGEAVLRVLHVQNAQWAVHFLLRKFNINASDDLVGTDFGQYLKCKRSTGSGGRPFLSGKTWKMTHDPWREISRTSFGMDYLKAYSTRKPATRIPLDTHGKMMELNCYDEDDNPTYGWDMYVQRISCYIQHKEITPEAPPTKESSQPNNKEDFDNGNTIIIFENSQSGSIEDTLIRARQQWESRWRRLPFYLAYEPQDVSNDDRMAVECMKIILQDTWQSIVGSWETFLEICHNHVSILEDKIFSSPDDETRAPELWTNSSMWLKIERLMFIHINAVKEMQSNLRELTNDPEVEANWLESSPGDFERLNNLLQEDLVKPTANLADLMYKSVGIRDSRHSLQLDTSMWRLSWITFIFLPLTFTVGFFGMNVDTFGHDPSIKWYFVAAAPMMLLVFAFWYLVKHSLAGRRQTPYERGIYEHLFLELATSFPRLWSRSGPRQLVRPQGSFASFKWRLILLWNNPAKTIRGGPSDGDDVYDDLGAWSRFKRNMTRRWTSQLRDTDYANNSSSTSLEEGGSSDDTNLIQLQKEGKEQSAYPDPKQPQTPTMGMLNVPLATGGAQGNQSSLSPKSGRPSSKGSSAGRSSGVMVEEERPTWLQDLGIRDSR